MSYAKATRKNALPEDQQPQPDQSLLEGAPADSKPYNTQIPEAEIKSTSFDAVNLNNDKSPNDPLNYEPSTSASAPEPESAIKMPESAQQAGAEAGKKVDQSVEKGKKAAKEAEATAQQAGQEAEKKAKEVKGATEQLASDASKKTKEAANEAGEAAKEFANDAEKKAKQFGKNAKAELEHAETVVGQYFNQAKDIILRPGTLGGVMGVANVGLLSVIGYHAYTRRNVPWDRNIVGGTVASVLALFGIQGIVAEKFANTPEGKQEIEQAKREGSKFYVNAREVILRPGVAGGLLGVVNVAVLGAVGYLGYENWDRRTWDRKLVAGIASALVSLAAVEGLAANVWKQKKDGRA